MIVESGDGQLRKIGGNVRMVGGELATEVAGSSGTKQGRGACVVHMFFRERVGKYVLQVCRTLSCALNGAERVTEALSEKLGIKPGETDPSGMFTLLEFECLGACDRAPIVMVNNEHWHEQATAESCSKLVDDLKARGPAALSGCHLEVE